MKYAVLTLCLLLAPLAKSINSQSYFKDTLAEFKTDFINRGQHLQKSNDKIVMGQSAIAFDSAPSTDFPNQIDFLLVPSSHKKNLVVIQSGAHGIEGYAGASIQNFLLEYLHAKSYQNTAFLYIHLINPAGMSLGRRTNLNNVDLNRNFLIQDRDFSQKSEDYAAINDFLNPETPYQSGVFKTLSFYFNSLYLIYNHSIDTLRRSILKGQHMYPTGVYFGGQQHQPEFTALKKIWDAQILGYEKIIYIDLHTGYGEKGRLHLLGGHSEDERSKKLANVFHPTGIDFSNNKNFYETKGDILGYFDNTYKSQGDIFAVTFEFGTLNSQTTLGSLDSLYRMVSENQAYHHKTTDEDSLKQVKKSFRDMFYPPDFEWRDKTLIQTRNEIDKIVQKSENGSF
ncbi:MAG: DUF2817 domain-containing protein [Bdellovibrionaceae bacterium]|nr:DUF2817 domain-containing protein [Pseudobdellovibrionaceae bacterium]